MVDRTMFDNVLADRRQISLRGEIDVRDKDHILRTLKYLNILGDSPIELLIDSMGGNAALRGYITDAISFSKAPIHAIVEGCAGSSAFNILQACHVRRAYPSARMMFHAPGLFGIRVDQNNFEELINETKQMYSMQVATLARRSGQSEDQWRTWSKAEKWFNAEDALKFGIIDEILNPPVR